MADPRWIGLFFQFVAPLWRKSMSTALDEDIVHAGRVATRLQLKGIGEFSFEHDICAMGISSDDFYVAAAVPDGTVYVLRKDETSQRPGPLRWTLHTSCKWCSFVAIDNEARFCLLVDGYDVMHVFHRSGGDEWHEEKCSRQEICFKHVADRYVAEFLNDGDNISWSLIPKSNFKGCRLTRYRRWFGGYAWR